MSKEISLFEQINVRVPDLFQECSTCEPAYINSKAVVEQLRADGISNLVEVVCEPSIVGKVEMSIKPVGQLVINGEKTGDFGRVELRKVVDCPGLQAQSAATPPQG